MFIQIESLLVNIINRQENLRSNSQQFIHVEDILRIDSILQLMIWNASENFVNLGKINAEGS